MTRRIGILGGTFDPIHHGHLDAADAARAQLELDELLVIPSHVPPHRPVQPRASAYHRFAMIALASQRRTPLRLSDAELERDGPSFTVDTLRRLHAEGLSPSQLFFIVGADAFAEISTWRAYPAVLDAAHFAVIARPGTTMSEALGRYPELGSRVRVRGDIGRTPGTALYPIEARTRDVSSTMIRERVGTGRSIDDLVPAEVAAYIAAQALYRAVDELHG